MSRFIFIVMILMVITPAFADENSQQEQINRGFDYIKSGDYQKAANVFGTVLLNNCRNADAYFGLGICDLKIGDNEVMTNAKMVTNAISDFKYAQKLGADYKEIHYYLGLCYLAIHKRDVAVKEYEILKGIDSELANQLLVRINAYRPLEQYTRGEVIYYDSAGRRVSEAEYREMEMIEGIIKAEKEAREAERRAKEAGRRVIIYRQPSNDEAVSPEEVVIPQRRSRMVNPPRGAINVTTGEFYPPAAGGVIDPKTGTFYHDVGGGYINTRTGNFSPKIGQ